MSLRGLDAALPASADSCFLSSPCSLCGKSVPVLGWEYLKPVELAPVAGGRMKISRWVR